MLNCLWLHEEFCLEIGEESRMPVSQEGISIKIIILPFWSGGSTDSSNLSTVSKIEFYHPKDNDKINWVLVEEPEVFLQVPFPSLDQNTETEHIPNSDNGWLQPGFLSTLTSHLSQSPVNVLYVTFTKKTPPLLEKKGWWRKTFLVSSLPTHTHVVLQSSFFRENCSHPPSLQPSGLKCWLWAPWWRAINRGCGVLVTHYWR